MEMFLWAAQVEGEKGQVSQLSVATEQPDWADAVARLGETKKRIMAGPNPAGIVWVAKK